MDERNLTMMEINKIHEMIRRKEISPVEIVQECIKRTDALQTKLNAYITFLKEEAIQEAVKAEKEIMTKGPRSPIHGIPITFKDVYLTENILTTAGSKILSDFKPNYSSTIVERLTQAGAIVMGKTNLHEWSLGVTNEDSFYGASRNPWDSSKITGGSSGGSAVTVATGMAYMSMGTDTGGSVRIPAAMCGVVGFKPTYGLLSSFGVIPISLTLDHPGPIARSVYDIALTMDLITGFDPKDPCPERYKGEKTNFCDELKEMKDLKGVKIGIPSNFYFDKVDFEVEKLIQQAILNLKDIGAEIVNINMPYTDEAIDSSSVIMFSEGAYNHKDRLEKYPDDYQPKVKTRIEQGMKYTATEYISVLKKREEIIDAWNKTASKIDVVAVPTLPITAYKIGSDTIVVRGKEELAGAMCVRHTRFANLTGCPALSIPCGLTPNGLPAGITFMGKNQDDSTVLKIGNIYERHYPYHLFA